MSKARLLIVEDDHHLLNGIRDILELDHYVVQTAQNGVQALDLLQASNGLLPDLIVSDIMMPQMDGLDLLQAVRKNAAWVKIPFIFLTARGEKADVQRGKRLGVDDYLIKPFDPEDLLVAVDSRLKRQEAINTVHVGAISDLKRSILTILNHEFRTPLTLVVAYADMLKGFSPEEMTEEELLLFLRGVNQGADRLRRLIENFILMVELETGDVRRNYDYRKFPIEDLGNLVMMEAESTIHARDELHAYQLNIEPNLPTIMGDRAYLQVVVRELVDNACKFSPNESVVEIAVCREGDSVVLRVSDHGRGIPEHELENIWKSFYQVRREVYEDQGAGTGLALVRGLVEIHGGEVSVTSEEHQGSTFCVMLPL